ncbi:hypothetical protein RUE5091_04252 [Ruegeria denitrificans]|uniref:Uncharacterized protein n=1 Tax=Ruegeria denitrificans TaxID=1715692 RepID=A0A0P1IJZ0_9RHOB|nr:hypothetical protein [Ruegeria denitrificans]CUK18406.1 hypothetical protein RUE5091_04252 [Ruegeria denitrificans]
MIGPNHIAGAENLLFRCGGLTTDDHLLILRESAEHDYYDADITDIIVECAKQHDIRTSVRTIPFDPLKAHLSSDLITEMKSADRTLFLSRTGDQIRFNAEMADIRPIMSYALDADMLASGFGRANYDGFVALKGAVNTALSIASKIHVTCPLGTDFSGPGAAFAKNAAADVSVTRFPMSVFAPVPVAGFSGVVMQDGFLVGTGSRFYEPYGCELNEPLAVQFDCSRLIGFSGHPMDVHCAQMHYEKVGKMFDLDPMTMHSWHAGIHPGCAYTSPAFENYERWSGSAFGNPRLLHFHTCGDYAPGEISLNVLDPTIRIDGVAVWKDGVFRPEKIPGGAEILAACPCIKSVFDAPAQEVGQGANGRLSAR